MSTIVDLINTVRGEFMVKINEIRDALAAHNSANDAHAERFKALEDRVTALEKRFEGVDEAVASIGNPQA